MPVKHPTASGISKLLANAGYTRSELGRRGRSGFRVTKDYGNDKAVRVRHHFWSMGARPEWTEARLAEYAKTLRDAGWTVDDAETYELTVTAREEG